MKALITEWHESGNCVWCEKTTECVTAEFSDGFLAKNTICWKCIQKVVKVKSRQTADNRASNPPSGRTPAERGDAVRNSSAQTQPE